MKPATSVDSIAKAASKTPARDDFEGFTWSLYQLGKTITAAQYQLCWANLQGFSRKVAAWQQAYDAWITPVLATPPTKIGSINLAAISLPLALSKAGLPIGVQFVGRFGEEHLLLQICGADRKG